MNIRRFDKWDDMIAEANKNIEATNAEKEMLNSEKQQVLNDYNNNYNEQMATLDTLTEQQNTLADEYEKTQNQMLEKNYQKDVDTINRNRQETKESIDKEKKDSYIDYMKQINQYGGAAEQLASQGLATTGYAESSKVAMYNTYQNRVSAANTALTKANVEYDRQMQEAKDNYDVGLAQTALNTLQQKYTIALQGFEYKNTLFNNKTNFELQVNDSYWNKGQTLQNRIDNYTNNISSIEQYREKMAEDQRQFDETMAEKKREYDQNFAEDQRQFNQQMSYRNSSGGGNVYYYGGGYDDTSKEEKQGTKLDTSISGKSTPYNVNSNSTKLQKYQSNPDPEIKVTKNKVAPKLSKSTANTVFNDLLNKYNGKTIKTSELEGLLLSAKDRKYVTVDDCKKIASYFGVQWQ